MVLRRTAGRGIARRFVLPFAFAMLAMLGIERIALAQSISVVNEASLPRLDKDGNAVAKRQNLSPEGVSLQDCIDDQQIQFTLHMSGFEVRACVQAWATVGQDCKIQTNRGGGVQTCWRVLDGDIPLAAVTDVRIPVRRLMSGVAGSPSSPDSTEAACGKVDLSNITVQFLYLPPGHCAANASVSKDVTVVVDTVGPLPPSGLSVKPGDTRIQVKWDNISGGGGDSGAAGGVTELTGVKVYCDVAGGSSTTTPAAPVCTDVPVDAGPNADPSVDAGTVQVCEDGGTTTTPGDPNACSSPNFVGTDGRKIFPTAEFNSKYQCGSIEGNTQSSARAERIADKPLVNGTRYAVAVAATDRFGNVGELSPVKCEIPEKTTDFWGEYREAGGAAGDGCAATGAAPIGTTAAVGIGATVALSSMLRRRRKTDARDALTREGSRR